MVALDAPYTDAHGEFLRAADGTLTEYTGKATFRVPPGGRLHVQVPGGGGFGDPVKRNPALVARDRTEGLLPGNAPHSPDRPRSPR